MVGLVISIGVMFWIVIGLFVYDVFMFVFLFLIDGCVVDDSIVFYVYNVFIVYIMDFSYVVEILVILMFVLWIEW